jgi:hypothetical protein
MKSLPGLPPALSFGWLLAKIILFTLMSLQMAEIVVVAYQQF